MREAGRAGPELDGWWIDRGLRPSTADPCSGSRHWAARKAYERAHKITPALHPEYVLWAMTGAVPALHKVDKTAGPKPKKPAKKGLVAGDPPPPAKKKRVCAKDREC